MTRDELADEARRLLLSEKYMNEFEATIAALEAAIPGLADVIDGKAVVVPREATPEMIHAGVNHRMTTTIGSANRWPDDTAAMFRAMTTAATEK